jgi:nitrogen fixation NifU-like protein
MELDELYRELIVDHYQNPRHFGEVAGATAEAGLHNPTCGDQLHVGLRIEDGVVRDAAFTGHGCSISMASASMLTEMAVGRPVDEARRVAEDFIAYLTGGTETEPPGDLKALVGVRKFPARVKCATLAHYAMKQALDGARPPDAGTAGVNAHATVKGGTRHGHQGD